MPAWDRCVKSSVGTLGLVIFCVVRRNEPRHIPKPHRPDHKRCINRDSWGESNPIHPQKRSGSSWPGCADTEQRLRRYVREEWEQCVAAYFDKQFSLRARVNHAQMDYLSDCA